MRAARRGGRRRPTIAGTHAASRWPECTLRDERFSTERRGGIRSSPYGVSRGVCAMYESRNSDRTEVLYFLCVIRSASYNDGMQTTTSIVRLAFLTALLTFGVAGAARAQGYIAPFLGYNFGGDAGCPQITNCEDKSLNFGVAFGSAGPLLGIEEELGYAKDFFGKIPETSSSVL